MKLNVQSKIVKRYDNSFISKLAGFDFETLENSPNSIFGLSKDLKLIYFNKAWFDFAKQNKGEPGIPDCFKIGTPIEKSISGVLKDFYINQFKKTINGVKAWKHEYECSSSKVFRLFSQDSYPLKNHEGIIVVNSLKIERVIDRNNSSRHQFKSGIYLNENGLITQCSNCRKTQRTGEPEVWDWIPLLIEQPLKNISHSICPICFDFYWKYRGKKMV